jgi:hypothetical protein
MAPGNTAKIKSLSATWLHPTEIQWPALSQKADFEPINATIEFREYLILGRLPVDYEHSAGCGTHVHLLIFGLVILVAGRDKGPDHNPDADRFTDVLDPVHHHFAHPPIKLPCLFFHPIGAFDALLFAGIRR